MAQFNLICMSFDGEYKRELPLFNDKQEAWEYANNLGSKWYFYPFYFLATEKTIIDAPELWECFIGKRVKTVQRTLNQLSNKEEAQGMDVEDFMFYVLDQLEEV